jgi:hypothetical protein
VDDVAVTLVEGNGDEKWRVGGEKLREKWEARQDLRRERGEGTAAGTRVSKEAARRVGAAESGRDGRETK